MALLVGLVLFFMIGGFGSLADRNRHESKKDGAGASGIQQTYLFASPTPSKQSDEAKEIENPQAGQDKPGEEDGGDPDLPPGMRGSIDKETYLRMRDEYVALRRGIEPGRPFDPQARGRAIEKMEEQQNQLESGSKSSVFDRLASFFGIGPNAGPAWTPLGPAPLPNGFGGPVSGRTTVVIVDPTNSNIIYLGAAQGGVWRSLDGGATWVSIFDNAQSLAIGALALAPSDHTILYVGTGEFDGCIDCFFGAGLYRIDNADTAATLVGPINPSQTIGNLTYQIFNGRSISKILVDPTNPATIFVATARGVAGSGANSLSSTVPPLGTRGVYRSTDATALVGSITFQKLVVTTDNSFDSPQTGNTDISDMAMEPLNPSNILVASLGLTSGLGGIYRTTNALAGTPTFSQVLSITSTGVRISLAINKVGSVVTAYAATSETPTATPGCISAGSGAVRKQIDPFNSSSTWSTQLTGGGGFCSGQCFYDMPIAIDPGNASVVYIGGQTSSTCGGVVRKSTDGGTSFADDSNGLHPDDHSLFFDGAGNIFTGNDGGIWKRSASVAAGTGWTNLNNAPLNTLQFEGIAVHPLDRNIMIGGTQDNGSELQQTTAGSWTNSAGGDGGFTLIDQSAADNTNVTMYHTFFFSSGSQIRYQRVTTLAAAASGSWTNIGCAGGIPANGINCSDATLFYAPMALGPGNPNTVYLGSDRLYRSSDRGTTNTIVSQSPITGSPVSAIAISPQDDNYRVVGLQNGQVWATSTGSSTLVNITSGSFPVNPNGNPNNKFVGRAVIDPNDKNVAYVAFSFFAPAGQGVWKITNLGTAASASPSAPVWTAMGSGIPSIPVNAMAIDPANSNNLFAGTDIGVYNSTDGGVSWSPFGTGLPRSAVFDLAVQNANRVLRAGTHGRGVWEVSIGGAVPSPTPEAAALRVQPIKTVISKYSIAEPTLSISAGGGFGFLLPRPAYSTRLCRSSAATVFRCSQGSIT
ncbi:MAG: hypothetical protein DMF70_00120 [Acidobacteria bacterium]|nr:MAG: hypothetical protein DMF70_00120 [Acidobacteriota bacterium]